MKWIFVSKGIEALVDADGKILAKVVRVGFMGPWCFKTDEYVDEHSAKAAAEKYIKRAP